MGAGRRIARRAAILAVTAAAVLAVVLLGGRLLSARRAGRGFQERIAEIDQLAGRGFLSKAESSLRAAAGAARSEQDWLRLLKRARALAAARGQYTGLSALARRAAASIPGSRPLARLALYARLRAGQGPTEPPTRSLSSDPDIQYLQAEAALVRRGPPPENLHPELESLLAVGVRPEARNLQALAARWKDEALLRDAGLAWMGEGEIGRAAAVFRELPDGPVARELRLGAAYDAGSWEEALALLEQEVQASPEMILMRADILLLLAREREAAGLYQESIARDPKLFWSPYLNLGGILEADGQREAAGELYRRAYELFPDSEAAATTLLSSLLRAGQREAAFQVLGRSLALLPDSLPLRWLLLELERGEDGGERYQAGLRKLYAEHPQNAALGQALAVHLLGLADPAGAWAVLEEYQGPAEQPWLLEARGLAKSLEGDLAAGADFLRRCLAAGGDGRARCNLAVVLAAAGDTETAAREFSQASGQLSDRPRLAAQARARLAELHLRMGNRAAARRESAYALELDPGNGRALLLLRTLEGE
jgi:tetratricopeptide (TPR) repeat protein